MPTSGTWVLLMGVFVVALALLGGSSRPDPIQNAGLRPIAALLLIPALYRLRTADLAGARSMVGLGAVMLAWMILQLIPMPPFLWQALPAREGIAELDALVGMQGVWRPLSLAPFRGQNAVFGLIIPIIALLLALPSRIKANSVFIVITGLGVLNAAFGILQVIGGPKSAFYLFAMASRGAPAGLFANENHSAVFSSIALLVIARLATDGQSRSLPSWIKLLLAPAYVFILLAVLVSGSRAGLATTVLSLGAGGLMMWLGYRPRSLVRPAAERSIKSSRRSGTALLAAGGAALILVVGAFLLFDRAPAFKALMASSSFNDLRWSLSPILIAMMGEHWLFGTGFGTFDVVYRLYEPTDLLFPLYVNQAHNDWAQLVIEGGLPAVACLLGLIAWLCAAILRLARRDSAGAILVFWVAWIAIIMAASAVDYPLRTPIFQAVSVWLTLCLANDGARLDSQEGEQAGC